jgi:hypothetical protein
MTNSNSSFEQKEETFEGMTKLEFNKKSIIDGLKLIGVSSCTAQYSGEGDSGNGINLFFSPDGAMNQRSQ